MENKQLQQAKDTISKKYRFKDMQTCVAFNSYNSVMSEILSEVAIEYHRLMSEENLKEFEEMPLYDLSNVPESNKSEFIGSWIKAVGEQAMKIYIMFGLKSGIESMMVNDTTGQKFIFSFKSIPQPPK